MAQNQHFIMALDTGMDELAKIFRMVVMGEDTVKGIALTMEILRMLRL